MSERDRCGPGFHYLVVEVVEADSVSNTTSTNFSVVVGITSISVDIPVSSLSSLFGGKLVRLRVVAVNSKGHATVEPRRSVTVTSDPGTSPHQCLVNVNHRRVE